MLRQGAGGGGGVMVTKEEGKKARQAVNLAPLTHRFTHSSAKLLPHMLNSHFYLSFIGPASLFPQKYAPNMLRFQANNISVFTYQPKYAFVGLFAGSQISLTPPPKDLYLICPKLN